MPKKLSDSNKKENKRAGHACDGDVSAWIHCSALCHVARTDKWKGEKTVARSMTIPMRASLLILIPHRNG